MPPSVKVQLLGVRVDRVGWPEILAFTQQALAGERPKQIVTVNGEFILTAQDDPKFRTIINGADLVIPDSTNVVWLSRLRGQPLPGVTPGSDLVIHLARLAAQEKEKIFLLGSRPGVGERAAAKLKQTFPGLEVVFDSADPGDPTGLEKIKAEKPAIVLVGYGAPKQELWINQHKEETGAKILVGVGGTFDMLAGVLPRPPKWLRSLHLEWLWRLILQPSRLGRIWRAVVVFPWKVLLNRVNHRD